MTEPLSEVMKAGLKAMGAESAGGAAGTIDSMTAAVTARPDRRIVELPNIFAPSIDENRSQFVPVETLLWC